MIIGRCSSTEQKPVADTKKGSEYQEFLTFAVIVIIGVIPLLENELCGDLGIKSTKQKREYASGKSLPLSSQRRYSLILVGLNTAIVIISIKSI